MVQCVFYVSGIKPMLKKSTDAFNFEKSTKFVERVLFLSFPTALVFMILAAFNMVDPILAIISLAKIMKTKAV